MGLFSVTHTRDKRGTRSKDQGFVFVINLGGWGKAAGRESTNKPESSGVIQMQNATHIQYIYKFGIMQVLNIKKRRYFITSTASFKCPASKKNAAECSKRCLPSKEKAFFNAALRHLSSVKLFPKNCVILVSFWDLQIEHN